MTIAQYLPSEGSTTYVVGSRAAVRESSLLTVADVLERQLPFAGRGEHSDAYDELETASIEDNAGFYSTILDRLSPPEASALIDASDLL